MSFKVKFDQRDIFDCTKVKIQLLNKFQSKGYCHYQDAPLSLNVDLCDSTYMLKGAFKNKELKGHANLIDSLILENLDLHSSDDTTQPTQNEFKKMEDKAA